MATAMGHLGGWFAFGDEGTWGTADTRDQILKLRTGGDSVVKTVEPILSEEIPYLYVEDSDSVLGNVSVGGSLSWSCRYEGHELIYKNAFGSVSSSQPDITNDENTYLNTYTLSALGTGMTFEIDADTHEKLVEGAMISRIEWEIDVNGLLICTITIIAEDMTLSTDPTTVTFPSAAFIKYSDAPGGSDYVVEYDSSELKVSNLRWWIDNNLDGDRRFLGSNLISQPVQMGKRDVGISFTTEFDGADEFNDFVAHTAVPVEIYFKGAAIDTNYYYSERFYFDAVKIVEYPHQVTDEGRIQVDCTLKAYAADSSNLEVELAQYNTVDASGL